MVYIKTNINGVETKVDIYSDELYSTCPKCGKEVNLTDDMLKDTVNEGDFASTSWYCDECSNDISGKKPRLKLVKL